MRAHDSGTQHRKLNGFDRMTLDLAGIVSGDRGGAVIVYGRENQVFRPNSGFRGNSRRNFDERPISSSPAIQPCGS